MIVQETTQLTSKKAISIKRVIQIPHTILNDNVSLVEYGTSNFQSICQLTQIKNKQISNQYFIGKTKKNKNIEAAFSGLKIMTGIDLEDFQEIPLKKSKSEYEGLLVFQDVPPKMKAIIESEENNSYQAKNAFDHCVDVCITALPTNYQSWIVSTIEKRKFGSSLNLSGQLNWRRLAITSFIAVWLSSLFGLSFFLKWKFEDVPYDEVEHPEMFEIPFFTRLQHFIESPSVRFGLALWAFFLISGVIAFAVFIRKRRGFLDNRLLNLKSQGTFIANRKEETALINHDEEKAQWGAINQSFVVLFRGNDYLVLKYILESLKLAIEGIYSGCIFGIKGTILLSEKSSFTTQVNSFFGWRLDAFWKAFEEVKPFKPTTMSIPRSGKNYFRLIKEKFIPGTEIVEGTSYKIPIERTLGDWYLGKVYRKLGHESYPYYLTPNVLTRQGLIFGPTGRGKTFFMYKVLEQMLKHNPEIHFVVFDLKGGEYTRFFAKKATVFIPGSETIPIGINIFRINEEDIDSNKRIVMQLFTDFIMQTIGSNAELSAFMKDIINQATGRIFLQPIDKRTMKTFVRIINDVLTELEDDGLGWIEKTRSALKARFRELFTGWFQHLFCVKESNFNVDVLREKNVIFKLNHLISDNDLPTVKFFVNTIMTLISSYSKELRDLDSDKPWLVCVFEESQKIIPFIQKRDTSEATIIENFVEISRAHGVASIALGQNPSKISERFHQAGFLVDFGSESTVMDKVIFGKDFLRAPEEKEQLSTEQMCFLKLTGEQRVLLKIDDYNYGNVLTEEQLNELFTHNNDYQQLREQYCFEPVSLDDLEGSKGKKRLTKQKLNHYCQEKCLVSEEHCVALEGGKFTKYRIPRKKKKQLQEMLEKEEGKSFIRFCHHVAQNKQDALCILLHYTLLIVQYELMDLTEAQELLLRGELYYQSLIEEQIFLDEIEEEIPNTEIDYELSVIDKPDEYEIYTYNYHDLLLDMGEGIE